MPGAAAGYRSPAGLSARLLLQRDAPLQCALQVSELVEDLDRALNDGPLDAGDLVKDPGVSRDRTAGFGPAVEDRLVPVQLLRGADDRHGLDRAAALGEGVPEAAVRVGPGAERRRGVVAGIGVDENSALDPECLERGDLLGLGRQPRQIGMLKHVVEREAAAHEHGPGSGPAVADVLGAERPVEPPAEDSAYPADPPDACNPTCSSHGPGTCGARWVPGSTSNEWSGWRSGRIEHAPHSEPPWVVIKSANPEYDSYERLAGEIHIVGRAVWVSRRL